MCMHVVRVCVFVYRYVCGYVQSFLIEYTINLQSCQQVIQFTVSTVYKATLYPAQCFSSHNSINKPVQKAGSSNHPWSNHPLSCCSVPCTKKCTYCSRHAHLFMAVSERERLHSNSINVDSQACSLLPTLVLSTSTASIPVSYRPVTNGQLLPAWASLLVMLLTAQ